MRKIREALRLKASGLSKRKIANSLGIGATAAGGYIRRAQRAGLSWPLPDDLSDEALEQLLHAVQGNPGNARLRYNYGLLLQQEGRIDAAEAELAAALELEPESLDYLYALADHYLRRGQLHRVQELAGRMIAAHPEERIGHDLEAMVLGAQAQAGR